MIDAIDEQFIKREKMTEEEFEHYYRIIENCKDICDSKYKVDGVGKCEILQLHLKKIDPSIISLYAIVYIGEENRIINGNIYNRDKKTVVEMKVERLLAKEDKNYTTLDSFKFKDDQLIRHSYYNYEDETIIQIENKKIKEKLR